jgi:adenosine deaminase
MQDFPADGDGHDHFFATFGKFERVAERHRGELLARVADEVARQNQFYLETMITPVVEAVKDAASAIGRDDDPARLHAGLTSGGRLDRLVAGARKEADDTERAFRAAARCGTPSARPACDLPVRFISQVYRHGPAERVFTQMALGMRLAERDPRFVGVNLVQPEDARPATAGYRSHMRMLAHLRSVYPRARLTLHAGELWPGLVEPEALRFHIREAVGVAGAERIGHGVALVHEDHWPTTARTMAAREIAVEVPFTSNAQILGVTGHDHPFDTYRRFGVPVVLATDDPGVSRTDISHEYQYAARTYDLSYHELKDLARASLEYAFLPGAGLWRGNPTRDGYRPTPRCDGVRPGAGTPGPACRALLGSSAKAAAQWRQEAAFHAFERHASHGNSPETASPEETSPGSAPSKAALPDVTPSDPCVPPSGAPLPHAAPAGTPCRRSAGRSSKSGSGRGPSPRPADLGSPRRVVAEDDHEPVAVGIVLVLGRQEQRHGRGGAAEAHGDGGRRLAVGAEVGRGGVLRGVAPALHPVLRGALRTSARLRPLRQAFGVTGPEAGQYVLRGGEAAGGGVSRDGQAEFGPAVLDALGRPVGGQGVAAAEQQDECPGRPRHVAYTRPHDSPFAPRYGPRRDGAGNRQPATSMPPGAACVIKRVASRSPPGTARR